MDTDGSEMFAHDDSGYDLYDHPAPDFMGTSPETDDYSGGLGDADASSAGDDDASPSGGDASGDASDDTSSAS